MTNAQAKDQDLKAYDKMVIALIDTEKAHGGVLGFHPVLYKQHHARLWDKDAKAAATAMDEKRAVDLHARGEGQIYGQQLRGVQRLPFYIDGRSREAQARKEAPSQRVRVGK